MTYILSKDADLLKMLSQENIGIWEAEAKGAIERRASERRALIRIKIRQAALSEHKQSGLRFKRAQRQQHLKDIAAHKAREEALITHAQITQKRDYS